MKINIVGLGKAGLPLAAVIADSGIEVIGSDLDRERVDMINKGINPIKEEPGLKELIEKHGGKSLKATTDTITAAKQCRIHIVIVPLFIDEKKKPNFSIIKSAFNSISNGLKRNDLVVLETTVPVGTTEGLIKDILEKGSGLKAGIDFYLAYSPERIMTGYSISRFKDFPKVIGGINKESTEKAFEVYRKFAKPIKVINSKTAELTKVAEGVYRDVNIALANELLKASDHYGINFWEIRNAARHDFCNILEPGNVSGHCIPVYPWFLINELNVPLIKGARELNDGMVDYYAKKVDKIGGKKVGVIGLSYREGVKEKAYSRSIAMMELLKKKGYEVYGLDPSYSKEETEAVFKVHYLHNFDDMDAIILMNKEERYKDKLKSIKSKVIDVKNVLD